MSDQIIRTIIGVFLPALPFPAWGGAQCGVLRPALACVAKREIATGVFGLCAQGDGGQGKRFGLTLQLQAVAQFAALPHTVGQASGVVTGDTG